MSGIFTKHAKKRMKQRGVSSSRVSSAMHGTARYKGNGVYRSEVERNGIKFVVVYKREKGKKIILSTWRK